MEKAKKYKYIEVLYRMNSRVLEVPPMPRPQSPTSFRDCRLIFAMQINCHFGMSVLLNMIDKAYDQEF